MLSFKNVNSRVASDMVGHTNIAITLDTCSHVLPVMQDGAAEANEEVLS